MQLAHNNRKLAPAVDTVFFMTALEHGYVSSSLVREIARFGGDVSGMLPGPAVAALLAASTCDNPGRVNRPSSGGPPIDIIFLVERLESLIANGKKLPLTNNVVVDQNAALGLIDELRVAVPEEVRQAKRINQEGERILEGAHEEAERIVARAQEQAAFLIGERGLTEAADAESQRILERAHGDADGIRRGADEYAVSVLVGLEGDLVRTLQSVKKGVAMLDERRAALVDEPDAAIRRRSGQPVPGGGRARDRRPVTGRDDALDLPGRRAPQRRPRRVPRSRGRTGRGRRRRRHQPRRSRSRVTSTSGGRTAACSCGPSSTRRSRRPAAAASGPIEVPLELVVDEEVLPAIELPTGASVDTSDEPEALRLTDHHELDLEPLIRDAIQLAEPIAPVCRPDCPGLCEVCGADLSEPGHVAHEAPIDPRLEVLRAFAVDGSTETD